MIRKECINCGKRLPPSLVCDACGTDYNEKPKCDHIYTNWKYMDDPFNCSFLLMLKCGKCGEVTTFNCSEEIKTSLVEHFYRGHL